MSGDVWAELAAVAARIDYLRTEIIVQGQMIAQDAEVGERQATVPARQMRALQDACRDYKAACDERLALLPRIQAAEAERAAKADAPPA